jgi:hypothetical protein
VSAAEVSPGSLFEADIHNISQAFHLYGQFAPWGSYEDRAEFGEFPIISKERPQT